ncbi:T9SS type A sorting domain-containing protein [bacterium]|nr:T9SS type A sorting domain-containing protein [bacterium]
MHRSIARFTLLSLFILASLPSLAQQIDIPRVEQMPGMPQPYDMRDWEAVAQGYDSFVFDFSASGQYQPFIWWNPNPVNYPDHPSFGLDTVVGTPYDYHTEAINAIPAVVGASLVGIDKSNQDGNNFVLMCEEYFNNRAEENVYLNGFIAQSGSDWWYETMPNIFFYQLRDLYPGTGEFDYQFESVADQFTACVQTLGGSTTPWTTPNMNYRAFSFSDMTPLNEGVREPEAAGAIAWILYMAYNETGNEEYRIAAEQAMEFLDSRTSNPSYELQLAYGAYIAARMNGELGTDYDLEQLVNWCFEVGSLRNWGVILGNWGGFDVDGLIGEATGNNDYAFMMNGFQQASTLVPMVRYDDRYARAIGKWVLNLANATRLFYPYSLDGDHQDSEWWSEAHDPNSWIGHESMREEWNGFSPFATGDASSGGWGATNLMLYASSHVGYLGGMLSTTPVEGILLLDLLKTDWYHNDAYPSYLSYNPYDVMQTLTFDVGDSPVDVYDCVSNQMLTTGVTGSSTFTIPEDAARLLVLIPSGASITHDAHGRMLANDVVVDFITDQGGNRAPRIQALATDTNPALIGAPIDLYCSAEDFEGSELSYEWSSEVGSFTGEGATVVWNAPEVAGEYDVVVDVSDGSGIRSDTLTISVLDNLPPLITSLTADPVAVQMGSEVTVSCVANDPDGDELSYSWTAPTGSFSGEGATVTWTAPNALGSVVLTCTVSDPDGAFDSATVEVTVGSNVGLWYLDGNGNDASGFENHGTVHGALPAGDNGGNPGLALAFDGEDDHVRIPVNPSLNFTEAMTINLWFRVNEHPDREAFIISHGSWQNRWKVSIIPEQKVRWTVKRASATSDLDSDAAVLANHWYNLTVTYGDGDMAMYIDGELESSTSASGDITTSDIDLTIGQMLPGDNGYNFFGRINDVRIYNRVLQEEEIVELASLVDVEETGQVLPEQYALHPVYPNPFNATARVAFDLPIASEVSLRAYNIEGRLVATLFHGSQPAGTHNIHWDARLLGSGVYFLRMEAANYNSVRKVVLVK